MILSGQMITPKTQLLDIFHNLEKILVSDKSQSSYYWTEGYSSTKIDENTDYKLAKTQIKKPFKLWITYIIGVHLQKY